MTNAASGEPIKTYATLRITGDKLVPDDVTRLLRTVPTLAYAKGERYAAGPRSPALMGRTGVWYFCTDGLVASTRLADHLAFLLRQVLPEPADLRALQQLLKRRSLAVTVTCFWHGPPEARRPSIPRSTAERLKQIPASIETDFDVEARDGRHAA
jgi:hypothetical protein